MGLSGPIERERVGTRQPPKESYHKNMDEERTARARLIWQVTDQMK